MEAVNCGSTRSGKCFESHAATIIPFRVGTREREKERERERKREREREGERERRSEERRVGKECRP